MTTPSEITARGPVSSSKVQGTADCVAIDKQSGHVACAVMSVGGFLSRGKKRHTVPWQSLKDDTSKDGYVVSLSRDELEGEPNLNSGEYGQLGDRA